MRQDWLAMKYREDASTERATGRVRLLGALSVLALACLPMASSVAATPVAGVVQIKVPGFSFGPTALVERDDKLVAVGARFSGGPFSADPDSFQPTLARYSDGGVLDATFGDDGKASPVLPAPAY